ncbi:MAG: hypothetical protein ACYDA9_14055 [Terriglobia bacterium]
MGNTIQQLPVQKPDPRILAMLYGPQAVPGGVPGTDAAAGSASPGAPVIGPDSTVQGAPPIGGVPRGTVSDAVTNPPRTTEPGSFASAVQDVTAPGATPAGALPSLAGPAAAALGPRPPGGPAVATPGSPLPAGTIAAAMNGAAASPSGPASASKLYGPLPNTPLPSLAPAGAEPGPAPIANAPAEGRAQWLQNMYPGSGHVPISLGPLTRGQKILMGVMAAMNPFAAPGIIYSAMNRNRRVAAMQDEADTQAYQKHLTAESTAADTKKAGAQATEAGAQTETLESERRLSEMRFKQDQQQHAFQQLQGLTQAFAGGTVAPPALLAFGRSYYANDPILQAAYKPEQWDQQLQQIVSGQPTQASMQVAKIGNSVASINWMGQTWTRANIAEAPPPVQERFKAEEGAGQQEEQRIFQREKNVAGFAAEREGARFANEMKLLETRFAQANNPETMRARSDALKLYEPALGADFRLQSMNESYPKALKGDQQAALSLLTNHIGMTLGLQKGARITKDILNEAQASAPWLQSLGAKFSSDGYLSGVTLTPTQMRQMVDLAKSQRDLAWNQARMGAHYIGVTDEPESPFMPKAPAAGTPAKVQTSAQPSVLPGGLTATGPNGHKIVVKGGQWVDAQTNKPIQ